MMNGKVVGKPGMLVIVRVVCAYQYYLVVAVVI